MKTEAQHGKPPHLIAIVEHTPSFHREPLHCHGGLEVGCCITGRGRFFFGSKSYEVSPGDVFVVNHLEHHIAQSDAADPSRYFFLFFDASIIGMEQQELLLPFMYRPEFFCNQVSRSFPAAKAIRTLMQTIWGESQRKDKHHWSMMKSSLLQICVHLFRHYGEHAGHEQWNRTLKLYTLLQPGIEYVKEHFREPVGFEQLAAHLALSPSRTRYLFKETFGFSFKEYLIKLRLNEAKRLLLDSQLPIIEVCFLSGFQSQASFYRTFKQIVGISPQEYRDRLSFTEVYDTNPDTLNEIIL